MDDHEEVSLFSILPVESAHPSIPAQRSSSAVTGTFHVALIDPALTQLLYSAPHPSEEKIHIRIQTYGESTAHCAGPELTAVHLQMVCRRSRSSTTLSTIAKR